MRSLLTFLSFLALSGAARGQGIAAATYAEPTGRYDHGVLGDAVEWGALRLDLVDGTSRLIRLGETRVFEDIAPRLIRDADGAALAMVVESDLAKGARLALYDAAGPVAATPFIGQSHRWLAPVGAGDLDGDGRIEIAYVDRPHLARTLRIWRFDGGALTEVAAYAGVTNHQIGWDFIAGGLRDCGAGPEMVLASADWTRLLALRFDGQAFASADLGPWSRPASEAALACR
ncbi:MAG: VCBS repeat-containing protein [Maritimibacter sp.]|nr:VCBS repeat-containing protein [Maritimibacter sp.]